MKHLFAVGLLGLYFMAHLFGRLILKIREKYGYTTAGKADVFFDNFKMDRIKAVSREEAEMFNQMGKCIHCGLCDSICSNTRDINRLYLRTPALMALTHSRDLPGAVYAEKFRSELKDCGNCNACEGVCPANTPLKSITQMMIRQSNDNIQVQT